MRLHSLVALGSLVAFALCLAPVSLAHAADNDDDKAAEKASLQAAADHMQLFELRVPGKDEAVGLIDRPLLTYGDSARLNENGTLWAWGKSGRPLALVELYQPTGNANWVHALSLTSTDKVSLKAPVATRWTPEDAQLQPQKISEADPPAAKETQRLRQLKELARRFSGHEFWDPDNSRFELRLLVQPVHRYSDSKAGLQDGAVFILAHGTNPEVLVLIEALGKSVDEARWHCGFARLGSAEMHVELDGKEIWKVDRAMNIVGKPTDPYWLFLSPANQE
jgi:hypothetical protein